MEKPPEIVFLARSGDHLENAHDHVSSLLKYGARKYDGLVQQHRSTLQAAFLLHPSHADEITEADARAALQQLDPLWDELFPADQARIVALRVERVDIGEGGLKVRLRVDGLGNPARGSRASPIPRP